MYCVSTFDSDLYKRNQALEEMRAKKHKYLQNNILKAAMLWEKITKVMFMYILFNGNIV